MPVPNTTPSRKASGRLSMIQEMVAAEGGTVARSLGAGDGGGGGGGRTSPSPSPEAGTLVVCQTHIKVEIEACLRLAKVRGLGSCLGVVGRREKRQEVG